jgi:O-succinylbenzoate synthase
MWSMHIVRAELRELVLPLTAPFAISGGEMRERRSLVVLLTDEDGRIGYGESPPFELPFYSEETLGTARAVLTEVLLPRVVGREFARAEDLDGALRGGVRGNPFARAGVETAAWDLEAQRRGMGLAALVGERLGAAPSPAIDCGVALGIPADRQPARLARQVAEAVAAGYRRVKIKIAPGWDAVPVRAARDTLAGSGVPLTVDANGAYRWPEDAPVLRALDEFGLLYIEQPLPPDELVGHARLGALLDTPLCLDETLRGAESARQVLELGGPRVWNLKVHRVGGLTEACRIQRVAVAAGVALWAGTMPESGLGSQAAIAMAAMPGFVYPSDVEPSARWYGVGVDVIELVMDGGRMAVPLTSAGEQLDAARFRSATRSIAFGHPPSAPPSGGA